MRVARAGRRILDRALGPFAGSLVAVRSREKLMALTFDDGPDPDWTPRLLDLLARRGMRGTFFLVGARAARYPELVARIAAEGHEIGNHSWDHPSLPTLSWRAVAAQLARARAALAPHGARLMRPPYGDQTPASHLIARCLGYRVVLWSVNPHDWEARDAEALAERILAKAGPGAIVLLHDTLYSYADAAFCDRSPTLGAVEILAERLADFRFVTVSELMRRGRPVRRYRMKRSRDAWLADLQTDPAT
jgi:peptidoglycan/xylan/chitin deacetylase (PgdA/CDA1 family)